MKSFQIRTSLIITLACIKKHRMVKYLIVIGLILIGCSTKQDNDRFLTEQTEEFLNYVEYKKFRRDGLLNEFDKARMINPNKLLPFHKQASKIHNKSSTINQIIETNSSIDSIIISITEYVSWFKTSFGKQDNDIHKIASLIERQLSIFVNNDLSMQQKRFMIRKLNCELLDLEYEALQFVFNSIDNSDYKFNRLEPVLFLTKPRTKSGETFIAKIGMAAYDSTRHNIVEIYVNGKTHLIEPQDGFGIYRRSHSSSGIYDIEGAIKCTDYQGGMRVFPFNFKYSVE
jgi:hypothetical protein